MPGPDWVSDDPADTHRIVANISDALADARLLANGRNELTGADLKRWHTLIYAGCTVPSAAYVGRFRGENHPHLRDYEVGVGQLLADGYPEGVGVWASEVAAEVDLFSTRLGSAFDVLDGMLPVGAPPSTVDLLHEVVALSAVAHGEWLRIHPFVNGNGRTARLAAAHAALRYGLPVFVSLKPRPDDVAYSRAARRSMGRPPDFVGDHTEAIAVFLHLLAIHLPEP